MSGTDLIILVGETGFEPATLWSQTRCATRLRHSPNRSGAHSRAMRHTQRFRTPYVKQKDRQRGFVTVVSLLSGSSWQSHVVSPRKRGWPRALRSRNSKSDFVSQSARWWARQESNPQPSRYERPALPLSYRPPARWSDTPKAFPLASRHVPKCPAASKQRHLPQSKNDHRRHAPGSRSSAM